MYSVNIYVIIFHGVHICNRFEIKIQRMNNMEGKLLVFQVTHTRCRLEHFSYVKVGMYLIIQDITVLYNIHTNKPSRHT
jgi:hypothetical protein